VSQAGGGSEDVSGVVSEGTALFDTAIGRVGISWRGSTVSAVQIPEHSDAATLTRLASASASTDPDGPRPAPPPPVIEQAMAAITALLDGAQTDLAFIELDLHPNRFGSFERAVYHITRAIEPGESLTYGEVAKRLGDPGAARAVGRALGANPFPIVIPCHRVLGADGHLTGFSANGGIETKRRMLLIEGCPAVPPSLFD